MEGGAVGMTMIKVGMAKANIVEMTCANVGEMRKPIAKLGIVNKARHKTGSAIVVDVLISTK